MYIIYKFSFILKQNIDTSKYWSVFSLHKRVEESTYRVVHTRMFVVLLFQLFPLLFFVSLFLLCQILNLLSVLVFLLHLVLFKVVFTCGI